ncbi:hypothetical protein D3C87_2162020 [compost metagenome]
MRFVFKAPDFRRGRLRTFSVACSSTVDNIFSMAAATYRGARELILWAVRPRRSIFVTRETLRVTPALA